MKKTIRESLNKELETLRQNCEYNAESHFLSAKKAEKYNLYLQIIPASIAAVTASISVALPNVFLISLSAVGAAISAIAGILDPLKKYKDYKQAGTLFTILKHDVRLVKDIESQKLSDDELNEKLSDLYEEYNQLCKTSPLTEEQSFMEARDKIHAGLHEPDQNPED